LQKRNGIIEKNLRITKICKIGNFVGANKASCNLVTELDQQEVTK